MNYKEAMAYIKSLRRFGSRPGLERIGELEVAHLLDPVAVDQACIDLIYASDDPGKAHFIERVESRHGVHTIETAAEIGIGSREYELVTIE